MTLLAPWPVSVSRPPEQQMLNQYFRAARGRDSTTAAMMSTVTLDPRTQGSIEDFSITSVSRSRGHRSHQTLTRRPKARQEADFQRRKKEYSDANLKTIEEILKLENNPAVKWTPEQAKVKPEWDKWRAETAMYVKNLSASRTAITAATAPAEASLTQPVSEVRRERVRWRDGQQGRRHQAQIRTRPESEGPGVTMSKVVGTQGGAQGKWIITKIAGL
jgi:hypothetical protein